MEGFAEDAVGCPLEGGEPEIFMDFQHARHCYRIEESPKILLPQTGGKT